MQEKILVNNSVAVNLNFNLFLNLNLFFLKGKEGVIFFHMPIIYFIKNLNGLNFSFCFTQKNIYFSFLKQFFYFIKIFYKFFYIRLRLKGLGYRIKKYDKNLYRFFIGYNHYFYFYVPINVYI
jgi:hypothetical protein